MYDCLIFYAIYYICIYIRKFRNIYTQFLIWNYLIFIYFSLILNYLILIYFSKKFDSPIPAFYSQFYAVILYTLFIDEKDKHQNQLRKFDLNIYKPTIAKIALLCNINLLFIAYIFLYRFTNEINNSTHISASPISAYCRSSDIHRHLFRVAFFPYKPTSALGTAFVKVSKYFALALLFFRSRRAATSGF